MFVISNLKLFHSFPDFPGLSKLNCWNWLPDCRMLRLKDMVAQAEGEIRTPEYEWNSIMRATDNSCCLVQTANGESPPDGCYSCFVPLRHTRMFSENWSRKVPGETGTSCWVLAPLRVRSRPIIPEDLNPLGRRSLTVGGCCDYAQLAVPPLEGGGRQDRTWSGREYLVNT